MLIPDFRTILETQTRPAHERVEALLALDEAATLARYLAYLQAMHAVIASVEDILARDVRLREFDLEPRRKCQRLERDLAFFGMPPAPGHVPLPEDRAARVGWLYVIEGATLGGRVLLRRLVPRWSLAPERGAAFLAGYGERTAQMWRTFVDALNSTAFTAEEKQACVAGAMQAFSVIEQQLRDSIAGARLDLGGHDGRALASGHPADGA